MNRFGKLRSGTWLVLVMVGFGVALTTGLFFYSQMHTAPFRDITRSISLRYPDSQPKVEGGKLRLDKPGETILRITMQVPFNPDDRERTESFARELSAFIADQYNISSYDVVEVNLFHWTDDETFSIQSTRLNTTKLPARHSAGKR